MTNRETQATRTHTSVRLLGFGRVLLVLCYVLGLLLVPAVLPTQAAPPSDYSRTGASHSLIGPPLRLQDLIRLAAAPQYPSQPAVSGRDALAGAALDKSQSVTTATIGDPVIYTITADFLDSSLYTSTLVTDTLPQVDSAIAISVTSVLTQNTNAANAWLIGPLGGQVITFTTTDGSVQGPETITITIQGVVEDDPAVDRDDVLTNRADLAYVAQGQPQSFTDSESLTVIEPLLNIGKLAASSSGSTNNLDGTAILTYTISLTNTGTASAYDVLITDSIPTGISVTTVYAGGNLSGDGRTITWSLSTIGHSAPANTAVVSYTAVLTPGVPAGATFTNAVTATYTSRSGADPNERSYGPITDTEQVRVADLVAAKAVAPISSATDNLSVGDVLTYTLTIEVPPGTVAYWPEWQDTLPAGARFITGTQSLTSTANIADLGISSGPITSTTGFGDNQREVVTWYLRPLTNTSQTTTGVVTMTFRAQATGVTPGGTPINWTQTGSLAWTNDVRLRWNTTDYGSYNSSDYREDTASATSYFGQPHLSVDKDSTPAPGSTVGADEIITYTLLVTNDGHTPAHDVVISDALPAELTLTGWSFNSGPGAGASLVATPTLPATGVITFGLSLINGTDTAPSGAKQVTLTLTAQVTSTLGAGLTLVNTAAVPYYDSQAGDGPDEGLTPRQRTYEDGQDSVSYNTPEPTGLLKAVSPLTATVSQTVVYTINLPSPTVNARLYDVFVTDTLDSRLQPNGVWAGGGAGSQVGISGQVVTATFDYIAANAQAAIVITATVRDAPSVVDGGVITDSAQFTWAQEPGGAQQGPLTSNTVSTTLAIPALITAKSASQPWVTAGDRITYTYVVTNAGTGLAQNLNLSDTLPGPDFQYVTGSTNILWPGGSSTADPTIADSVLTWIPNATLLGGEVMTLTFQADVSTALGQDQVYTNTAQVSGQDGLGNPIPTDNSSHVPGDSDPDDQDTAPVALAQPGVLLEPDNHGSANPGQVMTYTHILTNTGTYTDTLNLIAVSDQGYTVTLYVNGAITDAAPDLGPGDSVPISVTIEVPPTALADTLDTTTITATSTVDPAIFDTARDFTSVNATVGEVITPDPLLITVDPGTTVYFVQEWVNQGNREDRGNITVYEIPLGWQARVWRDPAKLNDTGVYTTVPFTDTWVWVATESTGDGVLDDSDTLNPAADTGGDGIPDSGDLDPLGGSIHVILEVTASPYATPDIYVLRERSSSNNDWVAKKLITPTLVYNDDAVEHDDAFKIVEIGQWPSASITITKELMEPAMGIAVVSDTITFTIRITNTGYTEITSLVVTDTYEAACMTLTSAEPLTTTQSTGQATWNLGTLAVGASVVITADFHADSADPACVNTVTITGQDQYDQSVGPEQGSDEVEIVNPAGVGDLAFNDTNGNGLWDPGEGVVPNVTIEVTGPSGTFITITNASGLYSVTHLLPGVYTVTATPPPGYVATTPTTVAVLLDAGEYDDTVDFGFLVATGVELAFFDAEGTPDGVWLRWATAREIWSEGFDIYRCADPQASCGLLNGERIPAKGDAGHGGVYAWLDATAQPGQTYWYQLVSVSEGGVETVFGPLEVIVPQWDEPGPEEGGHRLFLPLVGR
mgnify:CR=1 FL=1